MDAYDWLPHLRAGTTGQEVAEALRLRRRGPRFVCPSCTSGGLEVREQSFSCRDCGIHGDLVALVMVARRTDMQGAIEWLLMRTVEEVAERRKTERRWLEAEQRFQAIFEQAAIGLALVTPDGRWLLVNQKLCDITGYPEEELLERTVQDITYPDDLTLDQDHMAKLLARELSTYSIAKRFRRGDGSVVWINLTVSLVREATGDPRYFITAIEDISQRKWAEEALQESEERYRTLVETSPDGILLTDLDGTILIANRRAARLHGYETSHEMVGLRVFALVIPEERKRAVDDARRTYRDGEVRDAEYTMLRKDGGTFPGEISASLLRDGEGNPLGTIGIVRDITSRKRAEEALQFQAMHDALTGLPNRVLLGDRLEQAIGTARRNRVGLALLLLDLDNFKDVNDTFGHHWGDLLLQQVAKLLRGAVRESDTVARLGGDEFAGLLPATDELGAVAAARKVATSLSSELKVGDRTFYPRGSIGIALYPDHGPDAGALLQRADGAMYAAKRSGTELAVHGMDGRSEAPRAEEGQKTESPAVI